VKLGFGSEMTASVSDPETAHDRVLLGQTTEQDTAANTASAMHVVRHSHNRSKKR